MISMSRRLFAGSLCAAALGAPAAAQAPPPAPKEVDPLATAPPPPIEGDAKFVSQSTEVIVPVTVRDDKGKYVSNLELKDFRILDEGRPQKITFFSHDPHQPVVIGFLVDTSSAMRIQWKNFQEAILELVWALIPGDPRDSGYLITYGNRRELAVNTTIDSDLIAAKIRQTKPSGTSA